jgi:hypothetical protein
MKDTQWPFCATDANLCIADLVSSLRRGRLRRLAREPDVALKRCDASRMRPQKWREAIMHQSSRETGHRIRGGRSEGA